MVRHQPCTEAIIKSGITRVVVGTLDCNPIVSGKGVKVLEENNIQVVIGILENGVSTVNQSF